MTTSAKKKSSTGGAAGQNRRKAKRSKPSINTAPSDIAAQKPVDLDELTLSARTLRLLEYAERIHVQGFSPDPRPRTSDPGWEDVIFLAAQWREQVAAEENPEN